MGNGTSYASTEAALAAGVSQAEIDTHMAQTAVPDAVQNFIFFSTSPITPEAIARFDADTADDFTIVFGGGSSRKSPPKAALKGLLRVYLESFPDMTFNTNHVAITKTGDGSFTVEGAQAGGTNSGAPFSPDPQKLPPAGPTNELVKTVPGRFSVTVGADGKLASMTGEQLLPGPFGPPGFYALVGGKIPGKIPDVVSRFLFFDSEPVSAEKVATFDADTADDFTILFPPGSGRKNPPKTGVKAFLSAYLQSFPDMCFNVGNAPIRNNGNGSFTVVGGQAGGASAAPFSPHPKLPPAGPTDTFVKTVPGVFTVAVGPDGKLANMTGAPMEKGPFGPPGFYVLVGGTMPGAASAAK